MFRKIKTWWEFEGRYLSSDFIKGLSNLIKWFPIVWKDRDYDDHYIWELLKFKLEKQSHYTRKRGYHLSSERNAEIMALCAKLIDKIQKEEYLYEFLNYHEIDIQFVALQKEKFIDQDFDDEDLYEMKSTLLWEKYDELFAKYPATHRKFKHLNFNKEELAHKICDYNHNKAKKLLFNILNDNIENWWS